MLVSQSKFKLAAMENINKFADFAHYYGLYIEADKKRESILGGKETFSVVEHADPIEWAKKNYRKKLQLAINKLIVLDRAFYKTYGEHIMIKLESFEQYETALEEISRMIK